jgi:DNA-binding GntR family transcriptional regulator
MPVNAPKSGAASWLLGCAVKPIERPESLAESTLKRLRQAIVAGDLELGQPISERQLAGLLEVSKTPVREALAQLRLEGLVRILPHRGAFVFTLSQQEVVDICELRLALEATALRAAIERNRDAFAGSLGAIVHRMRRTQARGDVRAYLNEDTRFHQCFFDHCGNSLMARNYGMFVGKIAALRTHLAQKPQHTELSFREHETMLAAVAGGDVATAVAVLDVHIARTKETYAAGVTDIAAADRPPTRRTGT